MKDVFEFNLRHLGAVAMAGRLGSISAASIAVNMSQPALTQAVAKVEAQVGQSLFQRQPGGVVPTAAGTQLIVRIDRAIGYLERGGQGVRRAARLSPLSNLERRITLSQLRALIAVDEAGSFAHAAARTGLSQPALHRAARELEQHLGVALLSREGRTVQPTVAAARFLRFARLARSELQAGIDELATLLEEGAGRIRIGTMPLARAVLLPQTLARFAREHPAASVNVVEGPYLEMLARLREGDLDILVGAMRDPLPVTDVVQRPLLHDEPVIVGRAGHPLAGNRHDFAQLLDHPWVIAAVGTPVRRRWEQMFAERGLAPPRLRIECGSVLVLRGLMLEDDWLTLMSRDQFLFEQRAGLLTEIAGASPSLRRQIGLTVRSDWMPTHAQASFLDVFEQVCRTRTCTKAMDNQPFRYAHVAKPA